MTSLAGRRIAAAVLAAAVTAFSAGTAAAEPLIPPFVRDLAGAAAEDPAVAAFYRDNGYQAVWTDPEPDDRARVEALMRAFEAAPLHGLPAAAFSAGDVRARLAAVRTEAERARAEAGLSRLYLAYAHAVQSGILDPDAEVDGIERSAPRRDGAALLAGLVDAAPEAAMRALPPATAEYANLMRARMTLSRTLASGGWGATVPAGRYGAGDRGPGVVALRNRLIAMGYLRRTASDAFDARLEDAVRRFQQAHGMAVDGVVGGETLAEINRSAEERLGQVLVAMERERWLNIDRGPRHVWVNLADYRAQIVDDGRVTFDTRVVIGATASDRRSPEFSDEMEHMIVNPSWHVPRSIAVKEYLPAFRSNPYAKGHLTIYYRGEAISRDRINWPAVTEANWPFHLKQAPSRSNALGLVKFMFPNRWNIYLHDTPEKGLFDRTARAYSHGCIRVHRPFELGYALLAPQTSDPRGLFHARLDSGRETQIDLETHVPVHLVYRTAFTTPKGGLQFRRDVYGRDRTILSALRAAGVEIADLRS